MNPDGAMNRTTGSCNSTAGSSNANSVDINADFTGYYIVVTFCAEIEGGVSNRIIL